MIAGIHKVCPSEQELSVAIIKNLSCPVAGCGKIIFNSSALKMHVIKVHKVYQDENDRNYFVCKKKDKVEKEICHYHCPIKRCVFNIESRYFNSMKLLKQHFMKVHAEKKFKCSKCGNGFGMLNDCQRHEKSCGLIYTCSCSCPYTTKEALLTHAKRKQHVLSPEFLKNIKKRKSNSEGVVIPMKIISLIQLPQLPLSKITPVPSESISSDTKVINSLSSANLSPKSKPRWILPKPPLPTSNIKLGEQNSSYLTQSLRSFEVIKISTGTQTEQISRVAINSVDTRKGNITSGSLNISKNYDKRTDRHHASDKLKSGNSHKKSIAQTQTSGDFILKKAMASANLIVNRESRGAQCSPGFKSKSIITESAETQTAESHLKMAKITKFAAKCSKIGHIPFAVPWSTPFLDDFGCSDNETQTVDLWPELEALLNQQSIATLPNIANTFRDVDLDSVLIPRSTSSTQTSPGSARLRTLNDIQTDTSDFDILALVNSSHFPQQHQVSTIASNNSQVSGDPLMPIDSQSNFSVVNLSCFMDKNNSLKSMSSNSGSPPSSSLDDLLDSNSPISESTFYSHIETQTNEEALAYDQILMNMETQTTDEYLFPDLESVDIETQTRFVNLNTVETQTHVHALVSQSLLSTSTDTQTQTLLQELDLGGTELMDNHTQTTWSYLQDLVAQLEDNYIINSKN